MRSTQKFSTKYTERRFIISGPDTVFGSVVLFKKVIQREGKTLLVVVVYFTRTSWRRAMSHFLISVDFCFWVFCCCCATDFEFGGCRRREEKKGGRIEEIHEHK